MESFSTLVGESAFYPFYFLFFKFLIGDLSEVLLPLPQILLFGKLTHLNLLLLLQIPFVQPRVLIHHFSLLGVNWKNSSHDPFVSVVSFLFKHLWLLFGLNRLRRRCFFLVLELASTTPCSAVFFVFNG